MRRALVLVLFCLGLAGAALATAAQAAAQDKRAALVIGNGAYRNATTLPNPPRDARAVAEALKRLGFDVTEGYDLTNVEMVQKLRAFGRAADGAALALVFYAGHGLQVAGRNFLLPVDAALEREQDLRYEAIALDTVLDEAQVAKRLRIVILDACRDNPFAVRMVRALGPTRSASVGRGLAQVADVQTDTLIAYATAADAVAEDGSGGHSPYTSALLEQLANPALEINLLFGRVRDKVIKATSGRQRPFTYGSLGGDPFYLVPPKPAAVAEPAPMIAPAAASREFELAFWRSIEQSRDPEDFAEYLRQFPNGGFAGLARNRMRAFQGSAAPVNKAEDEAPPAEPPSRPEEHASSIQKPVQPQPVQPQPVQPQPVQPQPVQPQAVQSQPVQSQPVQRRPAQSQPVQSQPVQAPEPPAAVPGEQVAAAVPLVPRPPSPHAAPAEPSPADKIAAMLGTTPCAILAATIAGAHVRIAGEAAPSAKLDDTLQRIRAIEGVGSVRTSIRLIEQSHCRPIEPVAALLRTNRTSESRLTIRPARPMISENEPLVLEVQAPTASVFLTIDLYELDGTVRHLAAGASRPVNVNGRKLQLGERGEWPITGPPGQRLVVAIASAKPLDLGQRKASEPAAEYLAALRSALARAASAQPDPLIADVTLFETRAAAKPVQASDRRRETPSTTPAEPQSQPCGNILERAQLGETLSDADRAVLQSRCK